MIYVCVVCVVNGRWVVMEKEREGGEPRKIPGTFSSFHFSFFFFTLLSIEFVVERTATEAT